MPIISEPERDRRASDDLQWLRIQDQNRYSGSTGSIAGSDGDEE
jgi:hypothetical protein